MKHKGTKEIETERLILRPFRVSDAEQMFFNWASDGEVAKYLTWPPHGNAGFTKKLLEDWVKQYENDSYYQWCIELKENSQAIGSISVVEVFDSIDAVEIGYCIGKKYWGKGITSEALSSLVSFFFNEVNANRIMAYHDTDNPASGRVMEKCGLKYEGTLIQSARNQQGICDIAVYGLVKRDYTAI